MTLTAGQTFVQVMPYGSKMSVRGRQARAVRRRLRLAEPVRLAVAELIAAPVPATVPGPGRRPSPARPLRQPAVATAA